MSAELNGEEPQPINDSDVILELKKNILAAWKQIPPEHQVSVIFMLLDKVQEGEWEPWLKDPIDLRWFEDYEDLPFLNAESPKPVEPSQLPPPLEMENPNDFDEWMKHINSSVESMAGCSVYDLPDCDYRSMFEDGVTPSEAADEALIEAGFNRFE